MQMVATRGRRRNFYEDCPYSRDDGVGPANLELSGCDRRINTKLAPIDFAIETVETTPNDIFAYVQTEVQRVADPHPPALNVSFCLRLVRRVPVRLDYMDPTAIDYVDKLLRGLGARLTEGANLLR